MSFNELLFTEEMIYLASATALVLTLAWSALNEGRVRPFISGVIGLTLASALLGLVCFIEGVASGAVRDFGDTKYTGIPIIVAVGTGVPGALLGVLILSVLRRRREPGRS